MSEQELPMGSESFTQMSVERVSEELKFSDLKTEVECEHWYSVMSLATTQLIFVTASGLEAFDTDCYDEQDEESMEFKFCPKCGEKL